MPIIVTTYDVDGKVIFSSSTAAPWYVEENLSSQANGSNLVFTTSKNFIPETVSVYLNGLRLVKDDDFIIVNSNTIQFITAPYSGDKVIIVFIPAGA